ncbi:MAG: RNB domain-containing ribonuclease [Bacteroidales bacterium]
MTIPIPTKMAAFNKFIKRFGYKLEGGTDGSYARSMNKLIKEVSGKKEQNIIGNTGPAIDGQGSLLYREYGHYGLSFKHYTHFTSPIRRYPDMMVHRPLTAYLNGESSKSQDKYRSSASTRRNGRDGCRGRERASIKYKQVEFMQG